MNLGIPDVIAVHEAEKVKHGHPRDDSEVNATHQLAFVDAGSVDVRSVKA